MITAVLPTYNRAPLSFDRGEGAWLVADDGRRFLDALSALEHSKPREGGVVALAGAVAAHAPDAAIAVLLCGSAVSAADLRLACSRIPDGVRVLAVVADSRLESAELRRVGQTDVISIGDLSHLPSAVRKVLS